MMMMMMMKHSNTTSRVTLNAVESPRANTCSRVSKRSSHHRVVSKRPLLARSSSRSRGGGGGLRHGFRTTVLWSPCKGFRTKTVTKKTKKDKKNMRFFFSKTIQNPKCTHKGERKKKCMMLSPFYKGVVHFKGVFLTEERGRRRRRERKVCLSSQRERKEKKRENRL